MFIKKYLISFFILISFLNFGYSKINGNTYVDDNYNFEVTMPGDWKYNVSGTKKRLLILSPDDSTEFGIDVFPLGAKEREAVDVAVGHFNAYDSWVYVAGRHLGFFEKHGADSGFSVMYNKNVFTSAGREKKIIVQEYYFVKNGKAYIVTLLTDSEHWITMKSALLDIFNSFRIY